MCDDNWRHRDLNIVAGYLQQEIAKILHARLGAGAIYLIHESDRNRDVLDLAIDFIASDFARNANDEFYILKAKFGDFLEKDDEDFENGVRLYITSRYKDGFAEYIRSSDEFGKKFQRTIWFLLAKHADWERKKVKGRSFLLNSNNSATASC